MTNKWNTHESMTKRLERNIWIKVVVPYQTCFSLKKLLVLLFRKKTNGFWVFFELFSDFTHTQALCKKNLRNPPLKASLAFKSSLSSSRSALTLRLQLVCKNPEIWVYGPHKKAGFLLPLKKGQICGSCQGFWWIFFGGLVGLGTSFSKKTDLKKK